MAEQKKKMEKISALIKENEKMEESKDLMSNLKRLESMMKQLSQGKEKSDQERLKDIKNLKKSDIDLSEVNFFIIFVVFFNIIFLILYLEYQINQIFYINLF